MQYAKGRYAVRKNPVISYAARTLYIVPFSSKTGTHPLPCVPVALIELNLYMRVTPPFLVRSIQGVLRPYAVRKGPVRSTQQFR